MAGMARRGAHSARHRAGRSRPDAAGPDAVGADQRPPEAPQPDFLRYQPPAPVGVIPHDSRSHDSRQHDLSQCDPSQLEQAQFEQARLEQAQFEQAQFEQAQFEQVKPEHGQFGPPSAASPVGWVPEAVAAAAPPADPSAAAVQHAPVQPPPVQHAPVQPPPVQPPPVQHAPVQLPPVQLPPVGQFGDDLPDEADVTREDLLRGHEVPTWRPGIPAASSQRVSKPDVLAPAAGAAAASADFAAAAPPVTAPDLLPAPSPAAPAPPGPAQPRQAPARQARPRKRGGHRGGLIRLLSLLCAVVVVVIAGLSGAARSQPSVTACVTSFLLDWESGNYTAAAALTTGDRRSVAGSLQAAYTQLGAEDLALRMGPITVSGNTAHAYFYASIDLGRGGPPWNYRGGFELRRRGSAWLVVWSPAVITPGLGPHDRLAVLTTMPHRQLLLDASGRSLIPPSPAIELGVVPARVSDATLTARRLARVTGLAASDADEMRSQILAAPPHSFFELILLQPARYAQLRRALRKVPDLRHVRVTDRLFASSVPEITGRVGTETARQLVQYGDAYLPGTTVGLSGLQQAFQSNLVGTPTTRVVVQNAAGRQIRVLKQWQGRPGTAVRTTIDGRVEQAARQAVGGSAGSAAIVAVGAGSGKILGVASKAGAGLPAVSPLDGQYEPGQSFTIISTAALLAAKPGFGPDSPEPCAPGNSINGQTFANVPPEPKLGRQPTFSVDFAHACSTAFAGLSLTLTPAALATAASEFGIGLPWRLPIAAFTGSMRTPSSANSPVLPADVTGTGPVLVSPLDMALAAGVVASGSWHRPSLVSGAPASGPLPQQSLTKKVIGELRDLMAGTVRFGAARAARVGGVPLLGQVGMAPLAGHTGVKAVWFVGYRGGVAFAVLVFSRQPSFSSAVTIAHRFAAALAHLS